MHFRLVAKREKWCLTWRGWIAVVTVLAAFVVIGMTGIVPFLAVTAVVPADVLVVEGWIPEYTLKDAAAEFSKGKYRYIITVGGPMNHQLYFPEKMTYAELAALGLGKLGVASNLVVSVSSPEVDRERSFVYGRAAMQWLAAHDPKVRAVNVYSFGVHARRTRLVFERAGEHKIIIGVIAGQDRSSDPREWWKTSEGFKTVTEEALGYVWSRI